MSSGMPAAQRGFAGGGKMLRYGRGRVKGISCTLSPGDIFAVSMVLVVRSEVMIGIGPSMTIKFRWKCRWSNEIFNQ